MIFGIFHTFDLEMSSISASLAKKSEYYLWDMSSIATIYWLVRNVMLHILNLMNKLQWTNIWARNWKYCPSNSNIQQNTVFLRYQRFVTFLNLFKLIQDILYLTLGYISPIIYWRKSKIIATTDRIHNIFIIFPSKTTSNQEKRNWIIVFKQI